MKGKFRKTKWEGGKYPTFNVKAEVLVLPYTHYPPSCSLLYCMCSSLLSGCEGPVEAVWIKITPDVSFQQW